MTPVSRDLIWIASYPKSGNTWVRFLICNLLYGRQESAADLNARVPDLHELPGGLNGPIPPGLLKTHHTAPALAPLHARTAGAIYVVRQPADVLVSNFHYAQRGTVGAEGARESFDQYFESFLAHRGDPRWIGHGMGRWDENVQSWLAVSHPFPVLAVRYEDLKVDPVRVCRQLAQLLKPSCTEREVVAAVENSSFERMREVEEADIRAQRVGIFYKPYLKGAIDVGRRFMRRGAVGEGALLMTGDQRQRLEAAFAPLLAGLGYKNAAPVPGAV